MKLHSQFAAKILTGALSHRCRSKFVIKCEYQRGGERGLSSYNRRGSSDRSSSFRGNRDYNDRRSQRPPPRDRDDNGGGGWGRDFGERQPRESSSYSDRGDRSQQPKAPTMKDTWIGDVLYGVSPVLAALQAGRRKVYTLYVQEGVDAGKRKDKSAIDAAVEGAKALGATVTSASKHDLNMVSDNRPHQGLVLDCAPLDFESMDTMPDVASFEGQAPPLWLCLDEVMDPQNFGAALRSAFFLGASGVLTCRRNSSPLSAVVSKASAGAMELAPVHSCRSLPQTLEDARSKGWLILGAAAEEGAVACSEFVLEKPTVLVLGNEGYGLRTTVKRQCDTLLRIEGGEGSGMAARQGVGAGASNKSQLVDSLNVSVATGILIHSLVTSRKK